MVDQVPQPNEVWVAQLETPPATTAALFVQARAAGARTVLNMAPMVEHPADLLKSVEVAVLNEIELAQATNTRLRASSSIKSRRSGLPHAAGTRPRAVIATLGARGAVVVTAEGETALPGLSATVVDTTGAGDCFVGALRGLARQWPDTGRSSTLRQCGGLLLGREAGGRALDADRQGSCGAAGEA